VFLESTVSSPALLREWRLPVNFRLIVYNLSFFWPTDCVMSEALHPAPLRPAPPAVARI